MHRRQWTRFWTQSNARIPTSMWRRGSACTRPGDSYAETNPPAYVTVSLGSGHAVLVPHHRPGFSTYARSPLSSTPTRSQCRSRQSRPTCGARDRPPALPELGSLQPNSGLGARPGRLCGACLGIVVLRVRATHFTCTDSTLEVFASVRMHLATVLVPLSPTCRRPDSKPATGCLRHCLRRATPSTMWPGHFGSRQLRYHRPLKTSTPPHPASFARPI
jgi:hypothetical protein